MLKGHVRPVSLLSLLAASLTCANDIFMSVPEKHHESEHLPSLASAFEHKPILRGGGDRRRVKRFAWELDAESMANDYAWEGVPAWGSDEEEERHARFETRLQGFRGPAAQRPGVHCAGKPNLESTLQTCATSTAPSLSGEAASRARKRPTGLEEGLEGIGGGRSVFHDPDQFSIWRKGWMVRDIDGAANICNEETQFAMESSDDSMCRHQDKVSPGQQPNSCPGGARKESYTGLPLCDRLLALLILRNCSEVTHELSRYSSSEHQHSRQNVDSQRISSLLGHVPPLEKNESAATAKLQKCQHVFKGEGLPAVENLTVAWQKGSMLLVVWRWSFSTDGWADRCEDTECAAGQDSRGLRPGYCQIRFNGEVMPSRPVDILFENTSQLPADLEQSGHSNQSEAISQVANMSSQVPRAARAAVGVPLEKAAVVGGGVWLENTLGGSHRFSIRAASHIEPLEHASVAKFGPWSPTIAINVPAPDLNARARVFRREGEGARDRQRRVLAARTHGGSGSRQGQRVSRVGLADEWVSCFVGDTMLAPLEVQALAQAQGLTEMRASARARSVDVATACSREEVRSNYSSNLI